MSYTSILDGLLDVSLGEIIPSTDWFPPPVNMKGIKMSPNGFMVGYSGNALCASETYLPHAFNPLNQLAFPGQITGIAITGDSIIVFTDEMPYLVTGSSAANLTAIKIDHPQTCTNKDSIVNMGGYVLFASPDGLCSVTANDLTIATQSYLTREQWQAYSPSTLRGFFYEGIYIGISNTIAFMFDMRESQAVLTTIDLSTFNFISGYTDLSTDILYLLKTNGEIHSWETGTASTLKWKSKPLRLPKPICPAAGRIYANKTTSLSSGTYIYNQAGVHIGTIKTTGTGNSFELYDWPAQAPQVMTVNSLSITGTIKASTSTTPATLVINMIGSANMQIWADGDSVFNQSIVSNDIFRLPANYRAKEFQVEITGNISIDSFHIANCVGDLNG
jgi:hypothetical protein